MRILLIEDEDKIADFVKGVLEDERYKTIVSKSAEEVLEKGYYKLADLIILDLMLDGKIGGLELVKQLKKLKVKIPIIVLTALNQIGTKIDLFNAGVDDYLTKPFEALELLARVKSVYRRYLDINKESEKIKIDEMVFDWKENRLIHNDEHIFLTPKESEVLLFLIENKGKVLRNEDLLKKVWETKVGFHSNILQSTIRRLRTKLKLAGQDELIRNVHGVGYVLEF
jgi:DNA-binding response OmpR family regulator